MFGLCHGKGHRNDAGGRMSGPGTVLPVQRVGQSAVAEGSAHYRGLAPRGPKGGSALADCAAGKLAQRYTAISDGGALRGQPHAHRLHCDEFGPFPYFGGNILILQIGRKPGEGIGIICFDLICVDTEAHVFTFLLKIDFLVSAVQRLGHLRYIQACFPQGRADLSPASNAHCTNRPVISSSRVGTGISEVQSK